MFTVNLVPALPNGSPGLGNALPGPLNAIFELPNTLLGLPNVLPLEVPAYVTVAVIESPAFTVPDNSTIALG